MSNHRHNPFHHAFTDIDGGAPRQPEYISLKPEDIIQEGDEYSFPSSSIWTVCNPEGGHVGECVKTDGNVLWRRPVQIDYNEGYLQQPIKDIVKKAKEATDAPYEPSASSLWHVILYDDKQVSHKYDVAASSAAGAREAALIQYYQQPDRWQINLAHVYPLTGCKVYRRGWQEI